MHEDVDVAAEGLERGRGELAETVGGGTQVGGDEDGVAAGGGDLRDHGLAAVAVAAGDQDAMVAGREGPGDGGGDAAGGSGDERGARGAHAEHGTATVAPTWSPTSPPTPAPPLRPGTGRDHPRAPPPARAAAEPGREFRATLLAGASLTIMAAVSAMITDLFDGSRRAAFLGLQSAAAGAGGMIFLPLAGFLAGTSWNAPFLLYAVGLLVAPFAVRAVRETRVVAVALAGTVVFFMAPTQLPFLLQTLGASPTTTGIAVAGSTATSAVASLAYARVRGVLGHAAVVASSLAALGVGWVVVGTASSVAQILAGVLVAGLGVGLLVPDLTTWTGESVPAPRRGHALGALVSAVFLGQFLSPLLLAPVVAALGLGRAFALTGVLAILAAAVLAAVLPTVLPRTPRT